MSVDVSNETKGQFTARHMLLLIVGFFAVIFVMNLILAYFALGSWPGLLTGNGYDASQTYNQQIEQARIQNQLGWQSRFEAEDGKVTLQIMDRAGELVRNLDITAAAARPTNEAEDQMLVLSQKVDGSYGGEAALASGNWVISILAKDKSDGRTYRRQFRIFVQKSGD